MNGIWARKPIEATQDGQAGLRRVLGPWELTSLGVGAIIGAGIFVVTGLVAREHAGPAVIVSFVIAGLGCAFAALCYAEFASMLPVAGGAYAYAYASLGELLAWIIGWDLILEYGVTAAAVATGWAYYLGRFFRAVGIALPVRWTSDPISGAGGVVNGPAMAIVAVLTIILVVGIRESARFNTAMVVLKLSVILLVIAVGASYVDRTNWTPFAPFGVGGIMSGAAYVFFAYLGFDALSTQAEEARQPQRDVPFGILTSLAVCTVLYILVALVLTGMVPYQHIDVQAPVAGAFFDRGLLWAGLVITAGAVAGLTSVLLVALLSLARIVFALARDGLLPSVPLATVHPTFRTPHVATAIGGGLVALLSGVVPLQDLTKLVNIGTLFAFIIVCVAVLVLRHSQPQAPRSFRCPLVPAVPLLGVLFNLLMMFSLGWVNWARLLIWLTIGLVIYAAYGRKRSVLRRLRDSMQTPGASPEFR